jgi:hypothetical protein
MAGSIPTDTNSAQYQIESQIASKIPVVGGIVSSIVGIFGAAHAQAVKVEAQTLSSAAPQWRSLLNSIVTTYNTGQIDATEASSYVDQAVQIWNTQVQPIKRGDWPYLGSQLPEPTYADSYQNRSGPYGSSNRNPDSHAPDPCNGACVLGHYLVGREALLLKRAFAAGGNSTIGLPSIVVANTGGQGGVPAMTLRIETPAPIVTAVSSIPGASAALASTAASLGTTPNVLLYGALGFVALILLLRVMK